MLEFAPTHATVVRCLAERQTLDRLAAPAGSFAGRIAPDEVLVVGPRDAGGGLLSALASQTQADPNALLLEQSDGWAVWTLSGSDAARAFARLTAIRMPDAPAMVQGTIGSVPAKAVVLADRIHLLVSSVLGHHLRDRITAACADLSPQAGAAQPFTLGGKGRAT